VARPGSPRYHGLPPRAYYGVVSIVEVPGSGSQWAPGGGWSLGPGSYVYEQKGLLHGLTWREVQHFMITAAVGGWIAKPVVSIGIGLLHWNYHVFKDQTNWLELDTYISPGGGGPGQSLISTNPPPSVEEVGRIITSPGNPWDAATGPSHGAGRKAGGPRKSLQRGSRPRRKCKPGHYWNGRKCVRIPEKGWRDFSRKYD